MPRREEGWYDEKVQRLRGRCLASSRMSFIHCGSSGGWNYCMYTARRHRESESVPARRSQRGARDLHRDSIVTLQSLATPPQSGFRSGVEMLNRLTSCDNKLELWWYVTVSFDFLPALLRTRNLPAHTGSLFVLAETAVHCCDLKVFKQ